MTQMRVLIFLPVMLCFVACLCAATGAPNQPNKTTAEKAVKALKELTEEVLKVAENKFNQAESDKSAVEAEQDKAKRAKSEVKAAAAKNIAEVNVIAENAKQEMQQCLTLYNGARDKAENASKTWREMVSRAQKLNTSASIEIPTSEENSDYATIIKNASALTNNAQTLKEEIYNVSSYFGAEEMVLLKLKTCTGKLQIFKYQADSIVIYSEIKTMLKAAASDIEDIKQKKNEVNKTVQEMNKIYETTSSTSISFYISLCSKAESQLQIASRKLKEATECHTKMLEQKTQADKDLAAVKDETEEDKAKNEFKKFENHAKFFKKEVENIKEALHSAEISVKSASNFHQQMLKEMPQKKSESSIEPNKGNAKDGLFTPDVKTSVVNAETVKTEITDTGKSMPKESEKLIEVSVDSTKKHKSPQSMYRNNNSALINNPMLRNITKNARQIPFTGENVSKWEAENDSAKTMSISLLVALIVSAVLH